MSRILQLATYVSVFLFSHGAPAGYSLAMYGTQLTDQFSETPSSYESKNYLGFALQISLNDKNKIYFGWNYATVGSDSKHNSVDESYISTDTGPMMSLFFGPGNHMTISAGYNVIAKASYTKTGSTQADYSGTSYWAAAGAELELFKNLNLGGRLLYYNSTFDEKKVGTTTSSSSASRNLLLPVLTVTFHN